MMAKKICIMGLGYIGLPTGALLANRGYDVVGVDVNSHVVDTINAGHIHIVEPDLDTFVRAAVSSGRLRASTKPEAADVFMICVPTPFHHDSGNIPSPNVDYVLSATKMISPFVKQGDIVILESTSPVGTTEQVRDELAAAGIATDGVFIAHCPERVLPGRVMIELIENDRIVGGLTNACSTKVADFYRGFVRGRVFETNARTAEMVKLTENSYRDVNIAFANELSMLCDRMNIDVWELIRMANRHPRVKILQPGAGVGGHCIAVDPWFIVHAEPETAKLIGTARRVNDTKSEWVIGKIVSAAAEFEANSGRKPRVVLMGLAFKPDIDDLRESPAIKIAKKVCAVIPEAVCCEPNAKSVAGLNLVSIDDALLGADVVAFLVAHTPFKALDVAGLHVIDFCGVKRRE